MSLKISITNIIYNNFIIFNLFDLIILFLLDIYEEIFVVYLQLQKESPCPLAFDSKSDNFIRTDSWNDYSVKMLLIRKHTLLCSFPEVNNN